MKKRNILICLIIILLFPAFVSAESIKTDITPIDVTITENQKLIENAGNNHFNIFKRILWFSICWTLFEYEKSIGVLGYPWGTIYMGAYKNQAIIDYTADFQGIGGIP
jgi:hypothetical protein